MGPDINKFRTLTALIVAQASHTRAMVRRMVMELGVRDIIEADTTDSAMDQMRSSQPQIVLCDWEIEPSGAMDFCKAIRESDEVTDRNVSFIALADQLQEEHVFTGRDKGVTEILVKPFSLRSLAVRILASIEHPREFVESDKFVGPDRRRKERGWRGPERRTRR